ncbi:MAG: hypothetical protein ACI4O7_09160 [Aristaeellaceae bacterium]
MSALATTHGVTIIMLVTTGILALICLLLFILLILMGRQLRRSAVLCQDSSYILQKLPAWIQDGIADALKPELDKLHSLLEHQAQLVGDSQTEALEEVVSQFVAELNRRVEESAAQYVQRIAQSTEQFNKSLADINATVSVTLTDALAGFNDELQLILQELPATMKQLRAVTGNVPKVIDHSFAELQRSFDDMEKEMQQTLLAFRNMRTKIEAQQRMLGPVQPGMLRDEAVMRRSVPEPQSAVTPESQPVPAPPAQEPAIPGPKNDAAQSGSMNFSNY